MVALIGERHDFTVPWLGVTSCKSRLRGLAVACWEIKEGHISKVTDLGVTAALCPATPPQLGVILHASPQNVPGRWQAENVVWQVICLHRRGAWKGHPSPWGTLTRAGIS